MAVLYTNNARATLAAALNSSATTLAVSAGQGALFPSPTGSDVFFVTLTNASESVFEIVRVTARATDTFTVVRGQDGTSAAAWAAGDKVELRLNRALLDQLKLDLVPSQSGQFGKFLYTDGTSPSWQYAVLQTSAPTNVSATATSTFGIFVSFTAGANGTENRIYYSTANNVTASSPYIVTGGSAATVTGLSAGTTYYFRAATYNITGPTLSAATVSATTFAPAPLWGPGQTFTLTTAGQTYDFEVTSAVTQVRFEIVGGGGGGGGGWNYVGAAGGGGGSCSGVHTVGASRLFTAYVGGGGAGGCGYNQAGAGGGASALILTTAGTALGIAGGGGGGGSGWNGTAGAGGAGGPLGAIAGYPSWNSGGHGQTTQTGGGYAGSNSAGINPVNSLANASASRGGNGGNVGGNGGGGASGFGPGGSGRSTNFYWAGGGGGGGYFGGAGGWGQSAGDGGGGGSSFIASGITAYSNSLSVPGGGSGGAQSGGCGGNGGAGTVRITTA